MVAMKMYFLPMASLGRCPDQVGLEQYKKYVKLQVLRMLI